MIRVPQIHYLSGNARESSPHRLLVVDTEANAEHDARGELQTLRLWHARTVRRHGIEPKAPRQTEHMGDTAAELADLCAAAGRSDATTWIYFHNLSYDLSLTRLPLLLVARGYELGEHALASDAPWARLKKGGRRLRLADSFSWLPVSVEKLGEALGIDKPPLPAWTADAGAWRARCAADVHITATALCRLMDEWDARRLGCWSLTGPASGWNCLRHISSHRHGAPRTDFAMVPAGDSMNAHRAAVVIDPDPAARAFERRAIYSGRRDLWHVGKLPKGPYVELDLKTAHLSISANMPLPVRRQRAFTGLALDDWRLANRHESIIAEVTVQTGTPRYPLRIKGAVIHPVGTFTTTLCKPEIMDARERGDLLAIGPGYGYHVGPYMQEWARWCLGVLGDTTGATDPLLQIMVKGWSRTVPGRWGMLHARQIAAGASHVKEWEVEAAAIGSPPVRGYIFHFAGQWSEHVRDAEADDSFPAVLAHIQSWCRLALNRAIDAVPESLLVSCNTEGFWAHESALASLANLEPTGLKNQPRGYDVGARAELALSERTDPLEIRVKQTAKHLRLLSPQHLEINGAHHYAGVPRSAAAIGSDAFEFLTWPKLAAQMQRGDPRGYLRERRRVNLAGLPVNRWAYVDGCCEPVAAVIDKPGGASALLPPNATCAAHGAGLAEVQHRALRGVL